jgi:hypothetical protein
VGARAFSSMLKGRRGRGLGPQVDDHVLDRTAETARTSGFLGVDLRDLAHAEIVRVLPDVEDLAGTPLRWRH